MILIFGGTTEGRIAAEVCDRAAKGYLYATKGADQHLLASHAEPLTGAMEAEGISALIAERGVELIIDAAHPYAELLHRNITLAAAEHGVPTIRFERLSSHSEYENIVHFDSLGSVIERIKSENLTDVLALTGVKSAGELSLIANTHRITLRIMDREESQQRIEAAQFPPERVIYYEIGAEDNFSRSLAENLNISAIITKQSGDSGGYDKKVELARSLSIPLFVIDRPEREIYTSTVYGEHGLRRTIEQLLPQYYELRTGFTTGSAATAAAVAALTSIVTDEACDSVEITLPNGEPFVIPIERVTSEGNRAVATVVKDGGDDPDATHNIEIVASVELNDNTQGVVIRGGDGVGRVTLPGIGIEVGEAAINPVPQRMIRENLERIIGQYGVARGVEVTISVPEGERVGRKTFNPRLGIERGISILGTSGIVQPFSAEAFLESIARQIEVSKALGSDVVVINSGAMSERYIKAKYPDYPAQSYIHYGNMIGATIELAAREKVSKVILGVMIGKAVKLAAGALDTHSKHTTLDHKFLCSIAHEAGCAESTIAKIGEITTARQLWSIVPQSERRLFELIKAQCYRHCHPLLPDGNLEVVLISESGELY